ncbi:LpxL/LpxP family acyltransferase [Oleiharenicola lentus]|uniref:LpxL/LpxP family acyltransferase n=1 Tax=Oleiharenicola lentus TaxID=2508720 RepID=UPI003F66ABF5
MSRASDQLKLWLPQHWPMWFGVGVVWLLDKLPWPEKRLLARGLGWFIFNVLTIRRRVVFTNLRLCFPKLSVQEISILARAHYDSLALGLFEVCAGWWAKKQDLPPYRVVGAEHLDAALARGKGALLLTAHFTTLEIGGRFMSETRSMGGLYRDPNNPVVAHLMRGQRARHMSPAVHFDDLRGLVRGLRSNAAIWYAPDQGKRTKSSEILPFFGVPAITNTATSKIAEMTGAAVVPFFAKREADHSYTLTILPALENFPTADASADAVRINEIIEEHIKHAPEQYFWVHKRFKARGPGYPTVY